MSDRLVNAVLLLVGAGLVIVGYRMGTVAGLFVTAAGVMAVWLLVRLVAWRIPTIGEVRDRPREQGLDVARDLRPFDPDIVESQRFWNSLDTPSAPGGHADDPGRPHAPHR